MTFLTYKYMQVYVYARTHCMFPSMFILWADNEQNAKGHWAHCSVEIGYKKLLMLTLIQSHLCRQKLRRAA